MVFAPRFTITNKITTALTTIERARGFLDAAKLSDEWIAQMQARALVLEAHHTTHIEGTKLTFEQSEALWQGEQIPDLDPDDVRELLNYRLAFDLVSERIGDGSPVTEELLCHIHTRLVQGVRGDEADPGRYRQVQNYIVNSLTRKIIYTPPPPREVPSLMVELVDWINEEREINPILLAGIAQFQFVHIHPFVDGNGRTGRLLSTLSLYRSGYDFKQLFSISEFYDRDRLAYYRAIQSVREHEMDLTRWLEYVVTGLATQMGEIQVRGEQVIRGDLLLSRARKEGLKDRLLNLLEILQDESRAPISRLEKLTGANRRTLQRDLKLLLEKGYVREIGAKTDPTKQYEAEL